MENALERHPRWQALRKTGAGDLETFSDLHDARSELLDLDERRNGVTLARDEADCRKEREEEEETHSLLNRGQPIFPRLFG